MGKFFPDRSTAISCDKEDSMDLFGLNPGSRSRGDGC